MKRLRLLALLALLALILGTHAAMLTDPDIPRDVAIRLALINALAWAAILLPAFGVRMWLRAHRRRNRGG